MHYEFRKATPAEIPEIWHILKGAIQRRKEDGSTQWQDGYPNVEVIKKDLEKKGAYVLTKEEEILGYCAVLINDEPQYEKIEGKWLSEQDYIVIHRVAVSQNHLGKGLAKRIFGFIEELALNKNIFSIKADTNFDNGAMLKIFKQLDYHYCGEVYFRGSPRKAYEKLLTKED